jgi:hypothetical protein
MSTAGGPKLYGIGRGGDSDIVLCMDAHDAGSYPGEPTSNVFNHAANGYPIGWWGDGSNQSFANKSTYNVYDTSLQYNGYPTVLWTPGDSYNCYLNGTADIPNTELSTVWTFSCYIKAQDGGTLRTSDNDLGVYLYHPSTGSATGTTVDVGNGWYRVFRSVSGSSNYVGLAGFYGLRAGVKFYLSGAQLEKKTYPTPFVTGLLNSGEVYDGRPASVNLSLNDGSFEDKSPNKLALTNTSTTMPGLGGKLGGAAYYFNASSYLTYAIPSGSSALFGTANYTIDFWHYMPAGTSLKQYATWFSTYTSGYNSGIIIAQHVTSGTYGVWNGGWLNTGVTILTDQWAHVAIVREGTGTNESTYYLNGTSIMTFTSSFDFVTATIKEFMVGSLYAASHAYGLEGYMSDVRVCAGTALWTTTFNPPTRRNRSAPLVDLSGNYSGGNFNTKDMTDVATYRDGQVIEPIDSAVWDFDGTDDWVSLPNDIGYTDAVSVFAWVKRDTNTGILGGYHVICGTVGLELSFEAVSNYLRNGIEVNGTRYVSNDGSTIGTGTWHYVGFTWSTSDYSKKSYIDGVNVGTQSTGSTGTSSYSFSGRSLGMWGGASYALNGKIAAYQVYDTALTAQQVKQNFNSQRSRFKV